MALERCAETRTQTGTHTCIWGEICVNIMLQSWAEVVRDNIGSMRFYTRTVSTIQSSPKCMWGQVSDSLGHRDEFLKSGLLQVKWQHKRHVIFRYEVRLSVLHWLSSRNSLLLFFARQSFFFNWRISSGQCVLRIQ